MRKRVRNLSLPITRWSPSGRERPNVSRTNYRDRPSEIAVVLEDDAEPDRRTLLRMTPDRAAKLIECLAEFVVSADGPTSVLVTWPAGHGRTLTDSDTPGL